MDDASALAEALLGLDGFRVLVLPSCPTSCGSASRRPSTWSVAHAVGFGPWPRNAARRHP